MRKIGVMGAGSWGITLADLLARKRHDVTLWVHTADRVEDMKRNRVDRTYLPDLAISPSLEITASMEEAVYRKDIVLFVVPSQVVRGVMLAAIPHMAADACIVNAAKGIEIDSLLTMSGVCKKILPSWLAEKYCVLSGPSFALEVARQMPTAIVAAATDPLVAKRVQEAFSTPCFRVYTNSDVIGVELGGALKNVISIAAGICDGLGMGHNTRAALITRGLAEMARLGKALGGNPATFSGLAGMGDLVLTCTGDLSRNRTVGKKLGEGMKLKDILADMRMVAEGVKTTEAAWQLATALCVDMPITEKVHEILYKDKDPHQSIVELMTRVLRAEEDE